MKLTPKLNRVLLEKVDRHKPGDIIIPDNAESEHFFSWRVVAIGDARILESGERIPIDLKIGDEVIINPRFSMDIACNDPSDPDHGKEFKVCDFAGVMCTIEPRKPGEKRILTAIPHFAGE